MHLGLVFQIEIELTIYTVYKNDRLVQICAPNITYPILPKLVDSLDKLGTTLRGDGGFGSTGR